MGHLCTFYDAHHKGMYAYKDRFRAVFRALGKLTRFDDSETCNYSTKVVILDNQALEQYLSQQRNNKKKDDFVHDIHLNDEDNRAEYEKHQSRNDSHFSKPLHIHPNYNFNTINIYGSEFTQLFKNVIYMVKNRRNNVQFHVCQFKGSM